MPRCAVLGQPIAHSLSPTLHRAAYAALALDWTYHAVEVSEAGLSDFLATLDDEWRGLSLTMPLKRAALALIDQLSERAALAGAANTLVRQADGSWAGDNTDIPGANAAIAERYDGPITSVQVWGGGATATSVLLALADAHAARDDVKEPLKATLVVRSPERAQATVDAVSRHPQPPSLHVVTDPEEDAADLVVSTIPGSAQSPELLAQAARCHAAFEVLYHPWPTPLAAQAQRLGQPLVGGLDLLVHQAALQVPQMTGVSVAAEELVPVMRSAGMSALQARGADA